VQGLRLAIAGLGKIAHDQHLPAIGAGERFELVATADPNGGIHGVPAFPTVKAMFAAGLGIEALAVCTPPQVRGAIAHQALAQDLHVLLEKPPAATLGEARALGEFAAMRGVALYATWHSRDAPAVDAARQWLRGRRIRGVLVTWREDVRVWHPGQAWIRAAGGMGVFDPGINALSILTEILPRPLMLLEAELSFPSNWEAPAAARLSLTDDAATDIRMDLDFRQCGPASWDIDVTTDSGRLRLRNGGASMEVDDAAVEVGPSREYFRIYERFAALIGARQVEADLTPLQLVADAFVRGRRIPVEPFD
jgi:D-galactose 1-dehydrogenase